MYNLKPNGIFKGVNIAHNHFKLKTLISLYKKYLNKEAIWDKSLLQV